MATSDEQIRPASDTDTTPDWHGIEQARHGRTARRVLLAVFGTVLLLGASGVLGVRSATAHATGGLYDLTVTYPRVARAGHAVPLSIEVRRTGGFGPGPVEIRMTHAYFSLFDENGVQPGPSKETATAGDLVWEFDPPPGDTLLVRFDTRVGPNRQRGAAATVAVMDGESVVVSVDVRTRVMP